MRAIVRAVPVTTIATIALLSGCTGGSPSQSTVVPPPLSVQQSRSLSTSGHYVAHRVRTNIQTLTTLHGFQGSPPDGAQPSGALLNVGGTFYGATFNGGASNAGTVFEIFPDGAYSIRYSFSGGSVGANPIGRLA